MSSSKLIKIEVSEDIAAKIRFMAESGVFSCETGSVTLHFKDNQLKTIKHERYFYAPEVINTLEPIDIPVIVPIL